MIKYKLLGTDEMFGSRAGIIKDVGMEEKTPVRIPNSKEVSHADFIEDKNLATITFHQNIIASVKHFKPMRMGEIIKNSEVWFGFQQSLQKFVSRFDDKKVFFKPIFPDYTKDGRKFIFNNDMNKAILEMQLQPLEPNYNNSMELITINDIHSTSPVEQSVKRFVQSRDYIEDSEGGISKKPVVSLKFTKEVVFQQKVRELFNNGFDCFDIEYASIVEQLPNYKFLQKFSEDKDVWLNISQVPRTWSGNKKTSMIHLLQPFGFDSYILKLTKPFPPDKPFMIVRKNAKRFDGRTLGLITEAEHRKLHGDDLGDKCPICKNRTLNEFFQVYSGAELLKSALDVHEVFDSQKEFLTSREFVKENKFKNYIKKKLYMVAPIRKIFGFDLNQRPLK